MNTVVTVIGFVVRTVAVDSVGRNFAVLKVETGGFVGRSSVVAGIAVVVVVIVR